MRSAHLILAAPILLLLACGPRQQPAVDQETVAAAIEQAGARFADLFNRGAIDTLATMYATDAIVLPPNTDPVRGLDSIRTFWAGARQQGLKAVQLRMTDVAVSGDFAVETGAYTLTIQPGSGTAMTDRGKYVVVWRRQPDGSWKLFRDIFNTNMPAPH